MIEIFTAYIKTIAVFLIFSVFAEMIISDRFKKYLNVVLGLLMILTITGPCLKLFTEFDPGSLSFWEEDLMAFQELSPMADAGQEDALTLALFQSQVEKSIQQTCQVDGYRMLEVKAAIDSGQEQYGGIQQVTVLCVPEEREQSFYAIEPVAPYGQEAGLEEKPLPEALYGMKEKIAEQYGVPADNITIELQMPRGG